MHHNQTFLLFDNPECLKFSQSLICQRYPTSKVIVLESLEQLDSRIGSQAESQDTELPSVIITDQESVIGFAKHSNAFLPVVKVENASVSMASEMTSTSSQTGTDHRQTIDFSGNEEVLESIDQALKSASQFRLLKTRAANLDGLAERERKIIQLAADGVPNKTIAVRLGVSIKTVEKNRRNAYSKLSVSSTAEMASVVTFEKFFGAFA